MESRRTFGISRPAPSVAPAVPGRRLVPELLRSQGMARYRVWSLRLGWMAAALVAAACGDNAATSPSGLPSGVGDGRIKLEAVVTDRSGSCPAISFRLGGIEIRTTADTDFELPCAQVVNGAGVEVQGPQMVSGALVAREVEAEADDAVRQPNVEVEGRIAAIAGAGDCQSAAGRRMTVLGLAFGVGMFTEVRDVAQGCAGLAVDLPVRARGDLTNPPAPPVGALRARRVELRQ